MKHVYRSGFRRGGDIDEVVEHFVLGRPYGRGTNCWTGGRTIFSYALPIAKRVAGGVVLVRTNKYGTKTTDKHVRGLDALWGRGLVLVRQDKIDEVGYELAKRERVVRRATMPHGACKGRRRCVEPVPDEEKCR